MCACTGTAFSAALFIAVKDHYADQVKANEVGRACGKHGGGQKIVQCFGGKAQRKETARKTKA
jgi:hypothetical protein